MQHVILAVEQHVVLLVFLGVLLAEIGVPLPALPLLMTAATLVAPNGLELPKMVISIILAGVGGCLLADIAWYWGGQRYGHRVLGLLCTLSLSPDFCVRQTETVFARIGAWSLLLTKFFPGLSTISVAMAGVTKMPLSAFLVLDGLGALLFVGVPVGLGWIFRDAIADMLLALRNIGKLGATFVGAALALYVLARWWRRQAFIRQLHMDRITVGELLGLIGQGHRPLVFDVRSQEARAREGMIPGAVPLDSGHMDAIVAGYAREQETVVYCSCPNEASAAIAARQLKRAGFKKIRPLLGGIDAWVQAGQPLEPAVSSLTPSPTPK
ncbi:MAG TPA: DedA family protein/thiosulfate sulfurtransferase GlpE [Xanthobacteraceae bacterium]|jgi:membrane protein DedA with SNARE-associated domain/rhodanese-related sulfurtransferase